MTISPRWYDYDAAFIKPFSYHCIPESRNLSCPVADNHKKIAPFGLDKVVSLSFPVGIMVGNGLVQRTRLCLEYGCRIGITGFTFLEIDAPINPVDIRRAVFSALTHS